MTGAKIKRERVAKEMLRPSPVAKYIDDISYRQSIQKALNHGESYHKLRRAVSYANGGKLRAHNEMCQTNL